MKPEPSWGDVFRKINRNAAAKTALAAWQPRKLAADDPGFYDEDVCGRARTYLEAWKQRNYGAMAALISPTLREETPSATAGMVRADFESWDLNDYAFVGADFAAAAVCEIDVELVMATEARHGRMRWIREDAEGMAAMPNEDGTWYLYLWGPWAMLNPRDG